MQCAGTPLSPTKPPSVPPPSPSPLLLPSPSAPGPPSCSPSPAGLLHVQSASPMDDASATNESTVSKRIVHLHGETRRGSDASLPSVSLQRTPLRAQRRSVHP